MSQPVSTWSVPRHRRPAGAEGNEHLTAMTGALLLIGFAVEGKAATGGWMFDKK